MEYILEKCLPIARRQLLMTELTLSEISGFGSFSYFSMVFKRNVGVNSREFQRIQTFQKS